MGDQASSQVMSARGKLKIAEAQDLLTMDRGQLMPSLLFSADSIAAWIVTNDAGGH
jgi:hypothetical protein